MRISKRERQEIQKAQAVHHRVLCAILGLLKTSLIRLEGVEWKKSKEKRQYDRICRWHEESWLASIPHRLGANFLKEYDRDIRLVENAVNEFWPEKDWHHDEFMGYMTACSMLIDDVIRLKLLTKKQERPWKYLAQTLATFLSMFLEHASEEAEAQGAMLAEKWEAIYLEPNTKLIEQAKKAA